MMIDPSERGPGQLPGGLGNSESGCCLASGPGKFSYTAKCQWSSGDTDMRSSLDQEAKSSKTAKWSSGAL